MARAWLQELEDALPRPWFPRFTVKISRNMVNMWSQADKNNMVLLDMEQFGPEIF